MHIALRVSGLTRLATTLLGGTGLIGLAIGFAFRDIAENFLASILLSLNHPFGVGDLIEVDGTIGYVRKVTTRATILATFEGNQVQIPNSTIYKGKITNYSATPLCRLSFGVGIGFVDSAQHAQELIMKVLTIISTLFIPLSFIAGLYGMNFDPSSPWNMPELRWRWGYPLVLGVMALLAFGMLGYFRHVGWLGRRRRSAQRNQGAE